MAKDAMRAGKYTGLEVSAANTMEGCWDLVNVHEETGTHLMILENVNYRRDVLAVLNMAKQPMAKALSLGIKAYQNPLGAPNIRYYAMRMYTNTWCRANSRHVRYKPRESFYIDKLECNQGYRLTQLYC